ncbi:hypothetical protein RJ640_013131, partial [Escallonia rubra]
MRPGVKDSVRSGSFLKAGSSEFGQGKSEGVAVTTTRRGKTSAVASTWKHGEPSSKAVGCNVKKSMIIQVPSKRWDNVYRRNIPNMIVLLCEKDGHCCPIAYVDPWDDSRRFFENDGSSGGACKEHGSVFLENDGIGNFDPKERMRVDVNEWLLETLAGYGELLSVHFEGNERRLFLSLRSWSGSYEVVANAHRRSNHLGMAIFERNTLTEDVDIREGIRSMKVIREDMTAVFVEFDESGCFIRSLNASFITLVPECGGAEDIRDVRPIILVSDVYKRPNLELSPAKAALEETYHASENRGVQMLGQIKNGSCRPRAILFKVLADTVGLESRLMVGLPSEGASECIDSYKHMSVIVVLNSTELLVDLMRFPGQLLPRSTKAIFMTHISAAGESDSAENDSCDSPLEPNSPLYGFSDRVDPESTEKDDSLLYQRRLEASLNVPGPSLRNMMLRSSSSIDRKMSLSHSEPNIATSFWRRSRRKAIAEQRTASS